MFNERDTASRGESIGQNAEERFAEIMRTRGWRVTPSNLEQNKREHWDFRLMRNGFDLRVDVKAAKRIHRWDSDPNSEWLWIEVRNNRGYSGWAYSTKADFIAFERLEEFWLVRPRDLRTVLAALVVPEQVNNTEKARYHLYRRIGRQDAVTLIRYEDLRHCARIIPNRSISLLRSSRMVTLTEHRPKDKNGSESL